ncbi:hypothetical protein BJ912DRAFT_997348 [Pholiota molesta]|nr:hypothetical protein BJ912DRAFT_997348 [Pholiota molesta]
MSVADFFRNTRQSCGAGHSRRYGTYFSSRSSILETMGSQDSDSSWEIVTPGADSVFEGTEAQRVAMMYRLKAQYSGSCSDTTLESAPPNYSDPDNLPIQGSPSQGPNELVSEKQYTSIVGSKGLKVTLDEARQRDLLAVFQEAMDTANRCSTIPGGDGRVICPRSGCGNSLPNVNALTYHLHIHDIDDHLVTCPLCNNTYEYPFDMHRCPKKSSGLRSYWKLPPYPRQSRAQIRHLISSLWFTS